MAVNLSLSSTEKVIERKRERKVREKKKEKVHEPRPLRRKELWKLRDQVEHVVVQF